MPKKTTPLTNFPSALEVKCERGEMVTGFSYSDKLKGYTHHDEKLAHNYLLFMLSGTMQISCPLFSLQIIEEGHSVLIPQGQSLELKLLTNARFLILIFDTPMIKTEVRLLRHVCRRAVQTKYRFTTIRLTDRLKELIYFIIHCMKDHDVSTMSFYEHMNSALFMLLISCYDWNTIADFFHVIMDSKLDFKVFILNNYLEAERNVNALINLSGLPESTFHKRFKKEFGTTAKQWIMKHDAELLYAEAGKEDASPALLIEQLKLNNLTQLHLICKKYFKCSPTELIERRQKEHNEPQ